ncbi:MAG: S4 domain-containing protein [Patescibacteria group bacterium]
MFLDKNKTSPYFIYQYFMNTSDEDISRFMKMLTLIDTQEIDEIVAKHLETPENRAGQKLLAFKVVEIVHGTHEAKLAEQITQFMFTSQDKVAELSKLNSDDLETYKNAMGGLDYVDQNLFEIIVQSGLEKSNSNARNAVSSGAILINGNKITDSKYDFSADFLENGALLLQKGKKNLRIIKK